MGSRPQRSKNPRQHRRRAFLRGQRSQPFEGQCAGGIASRCRRRGRYRHEGDGKIYCESCAIEKKIIPKPVVDRPKKEGR